MKKIFTYALLTMLMVGCKKTTEEDRLKTPQKTIEKKHTSVKSQAIDCYQADVEGNTIALYIYRNNPNNISGSLTYSFIGKDVTHGEFKGKLKNNILVADYIFQSEGRKSERQIAFKLMNDQLVEGYGEREKNGTKFKDLSTLKFNDNMPLNKVACP